ncbi:unnamed protein product [Thelazia callipaeda]|uniref:IFRD domain-containing protein n=1 Tax=Thelazia callipaeda TaxID=103827 RepID=A0A0N5D4K8_THECL|nr:unnamed protein product [Thelazia callipaeda]
MGKRRNKNKAGREDYANRFSNLRSKATEIITSDDDDTESNTAGVSHDNDICISDVFPRDAFSDNEDLNDVAIPFDRLGEFLDSAIRNSLNSCIFFNFQFLFKFYFFSAAVRLSALLSIKKLLTEQYIAMHLEKWSLTLIDVIDSALRRSDEEAVVAASIVSVISIQLGEEVADTIETIVSLLCQLCTDPGRNVQLRIECALSFALCTLLSLQHASSLSRCISALRSIWFNTKMNTSSVKLFCAALSGWTLLVFQGGREILKNALLDEPKLSTFVNGAQLQMRICAAESLAILHEAAVTVYGPEYQFPNQQHLLDIFANLSTNSLKFRAKKDRRIQRSTFRQIYISIKDQEMPVFDVKFCHETLVIDSFGKKLLYQLICDVLHGSINIHLKMNSTLREWFDLGPVIIEIPVKMKKPQKIAIQNAINKTRDISRSKQRDKRTS